MSNITKIILVILAIVAFIGFITWAVRSSNTVTDNNSPKNNNDLASMTKINSLIEKPAPDFSLLDKDGKVYSNKSLNGKTVVLFFNEGIRCYPACWNQMAEFGKDQRFNTKDIVVLSVVTDSPKEWENAQKKMPDIAKANIVFDQDAKVSKEYGMLNQPSSMHAGSLPGHSYVVIDNSGIIKFAYDDTRMGVRNDALASLLPK